MVRSEACIPSSHNMLPGVITKCRLEDLTPNTHQRAWKKNASIGGFCLQLEGLQFHMVGSWARMEEVTMCLSEDVHVPLLSRVNKIETQCD